MRQENQLFFFVMFFFEEEKVKSRVKMSNFLLPIDAILFHELNGIQTNIVQHLLIS